MVNQAEQKTEEVSESPDTGDVTTDITDEFAGVNTFEDTPMEPSGDVSDAPSTETPTEEAPDSTAESAPAALPAPPIEETPPVNTQDNLQQRLELLERQNLEYSKTQEEAALSSQYEQYKNDLEQNGYLPDQAEHVAKTWLSGATSEQARVQQYQNQIEFVQGQAVAAEHFADKYKLQLSDLSDLRQHRDPQSMEAAAKRIASDREKDAEIAKLRAQLVPSQSFNDNQSTPAAANDEDRWLERYNQGDRSPQAAAAARKAAGLV